MNDMTRFEDQFEERLRAFARTGAQSVDSAAVARAVAVGYPRSAATRPPAARRPGGQIERTRRGPGIGPWRTGSMVKTAPAAAAVVAVLISGAALLMTRPSQPSIAGPSASASETAVTSPSPIATETPSPTPTSILWTEASLTEDWPAPVRAEPAGGAIVEPLLVKEIPVDPDHCCLVSEPGRYIDPTGDTGSDDVPWLDINEVVVDGTYRVTINLASNQMPEVDPTEQWIAYGVVFDDDGDGVADRRFGLDFGIDYVRTWMTDLHTGRTLVSDGGSVGGEYLDTTSPRSLRGYARFSYGGDTPAGPRGMELDNRPFYAWASVIQDGRVVATDYAPDAGWLRPSVQTKP